MSTDKPKGYRDLYWCWSQREPFIIQYKNDKPYCSECGRETDSVTDSPFTDLHQFIMHVEKPKME